MCPLLPEPPSHLSLYSIPLGCSRAPALGALLQASDSHWLSILHRVMYMFQCFSQIIPPSLSPTESKSLFFMFVSPLLPCTKGRRREGIQDGGDRCMLLLLLLSCFSVSDSVWPHSRQPIRLPHPWDSPGKNTGVGCHFLLQCMKVKSESEVAQ